MSIAASDIIAAGRRLGMDAEALLSLVAEIDATKAAERRTKAADRQRKHRESVTQNRVTCVTDDEPCHAKSRDMRDMRDMDGSPPASPASPPRDIINPPITPSTPHSAGLARARAAAPSAESDLRKSIVSAFTAAGSITVPDTSRAAVWIAQGYDPAICIATISELLARNPGARSLAYFETAIAEAHAPAAARAPPAGRPPNRPLTMIDGLIAHDARQSARTDR